MGVNKVASNKVIYAYLGLPGTESWLFSQPGLTPYILSEHRLRLAAGNPQLQLSSEGNLETVINPAPAPLVERLLDQLMRQRLDMQDPFILAVNLLSRKRLRWFRRLVKEAWGYRVIIIDGMSGPSRPDSDLAIAAGYDTDVRYRWSRYLARYSAVDWSALGTVISPEQFLKILKHPLEFQPVRDETNRLVIFSDIHGDAANLRTHLAELATPDTEFAFLGDAIDRGEDSAGVIRALLAQNTGLQFLGNHEHRLLAWYQEHRISQSRAKDFAQVTLPQLESANVSRTEIQQFISGLGTYLALEFAGRKFLLSHAGLEPAQVRHWLNPRSLTDGIALAPSDSFTHGVRIGQQSVYLRDIDQIWANSMAMKNIIAIHGHRNRFDRDVTSAQGMSINLTDGDGETFRYLVLTAADHRFVLHVDQRDGSQQRVISGNF